VNKYEQIIKQIVETSPSWDKDGSGIRGRTLAPLIGGAGGPNLMGDPIPQQFTQQRSSLIQQQDDPISKLNLPALGEGAASVSHPFKITLTPIQSGLGFTVRVNAGTVNNILAGNWQETAIVSGETTYVGLTVNASANRIVSSSLVFQSSTMGGEATPVKWGLPSQFDVLLGVIISGNIFQIVFNNLSYNASKRVTTEKTNPQAGLLAYDNWYTWVKTSG